MRKLLILSVLALSACRTTMTPCRYGEDAVSYGPDTFAISTIDHNGVGATIQRDFIGQAKAHCECLGKAMHPGQVGGGLFVFKCVPGTPGTAQ
jgi:hypothetical protein